MSREIVLRKINIKLSKIIGVYAQGFMSSYKDKIWIIDPFRDKWSENLEKDNWSFFKISGHGKLENLIETDILS